MKHIKYLALGALALLGMTACQDDKEPVISQATEFKLNTPPMVGQTLILTEGKTYSFTVSQPNYGLTVAPNYSIEVSLNEDFTPIKEGTYLDANDEEIVIPGVVTIPLESQLQGILKVSQRKIAGAMCALRGIGKEEDFTEEDPRPLYVRAYAILGNNESTAITSNMVILPMVKDYFAVDLPPSIMYTPGDINGWNFEKCMVVPNADLSDEDVEEGVWRKFKGFINISGEFKLTRNTEYNSPGNYGANEEFKYDEESKTWKGELIENTQTNFSGPEAGLYGIVIKITDSKAAEGKVAGTFELTPINSVSIIGDFNGWGGDVEMKPEEDFSTWKAVGVDLGDGGWKFRMNNAWDFNLGGTSLDELTLDGDNLTDSGVHTVILDLSTNPYSAKLE